MDSLGLSRASTNIKSYLWSFPGCPVQIHISFDLIERIRREILALTPAGREVGGLLIGSASAHATDVQVSDYFLIAPRGEAIPLAPSAQTAESGVSVDTAEAVPYVICSENLAHALASCSATQRQVVGYFRMHWGPRIQLRAQDLECIRQSFQDPKNVFLVIRPHDGRASAGFFFWQEGSVFGDSTLTFPFSAAELFKPAWNTLVGGTQPEGRMLGAMTRVRERISNGGNRVGLALFAVAVLFLVVIFAGHGLFTNDRPAPDGLGALRLRAHRDGLEVQVTWDSSNPQLAHAREANLLIWDGPGQPVYLPLTPAELRSGRMVVTSVADRVGIRMDVVAESGEAKIESISLSRENPASSSSARPSASSEPQKAKAKAGAQPRSAGTPSPKRARIFEDLSEPNRTRAGASRDSAPAPAFHALDSAAGGPMLAAEPITELQAIIPPDLKARIDSDNVIGVRVEIDAAGRVTSAKMASQKGPVAESLARYAVTAALGWRFRAATQNGRPVRSEKTIEFLFRPNN
jgi:hypothetical protein